MNTFDGLFGPLATLECRRAVRPRWVLWGRLLAGAPAAGIVVVVAWIWMLISDLEIGMMPGPFLAGGLAAIEVAQILIALLVGPALIAGAIAGEKDRGTLSMLLASDLSPADIVWGRLLGCFSQVVLFMAAGGPPLVLLAGICGADLRQLALLLALPAAVAFGSAGLTVAVSTLARRGRDALLTVYLLEVLLLVGSYFGASSLATLAWMSSFNPFAASFALANYGIMPPALLAVGLWLALGISGLMIAIWQLRPAYLRQTGGEAGGRRAKHRRAPAIGDRPMLWKELYQERSGNFGAFGFWLTVILIVFLIVGGLFVSAQLICNHVLGRNDLNDIGNAFARSINGSSALLLWLAQWMLGLRALGVVASERQRSTWDAILTSPLEGKEIVLAKVWGSVYALRWLLAALCFAWTAATLNGAMDPKEFVNDLVLLLCGGAFMVAAGVVLGIALSGASATRGMATLIGVWLAAAILSGFFAWLISVIVQLLMILVWATVILFINMPALFETGADPITAYWGTIFVGLRIGLYLAAALLAVSWSIARFDRLAGRLGDWSLTRRVVQFYNDLVDTPETPAVRSASESQLVSSAEPPRAN